MATRIPLVLGADGLLQQLQGADTIASTAGGTASASAASSTLPGGVILKAGTLAVTSGTGSLTFAVAFPNACIAVVATFYTTAATTTSSYSVVIKAYSATGFTAEVSSLGGTSLTITAASGTVLWQAVGY